MSICSNTLEAILRFLAPQIKLIRTLANLTRLVEIGSITGGTSISNELRSATLFTGLTRPQMFAGVTYTFFIINVVITVELFLIFRSWWILLAALAMHGIGALLCLREPRFFDLWITRVRNCPRIKNYSLWRCNSYRP